ncbi:acetyl-CoA carboxylase biotin carboxyl carrier protein subunit [Lactobacillus sp. CBA3605]|uniref:acetyl-CoA carboxylase biotin carboxyl carrier protein n=1 Tax=Lactobacillus sp. CBA3605 TaxID=2099788 RepID=UPI000CFDBAD3|nr:biotin/lipoyl-containing protein [Lactobacillus sp. CBA3605]AVK61878.1 acetyl-CoA carboxylase biotin carboxyl carrier protein subunit [Lactobacillus sp. CBA3605]
MALKDLDRLVEKYAQQGYQHIRVKAGDLEIEVTKPVPAAVAAKLPVTAPTNVATTTITSPMVGVVHLAADLAVGQTITAGQELGQIESMKLFNPLKSATAGTLMAILIADEAPVEFEQPLFKMRKDR